MEMNQLVQQLRTGRHTLVVVADGGSVRTFDGRGVADLYRLWSEQPAVLRGASVADKVVGKGAAALMIAGSVREVYAEVVSEAARLEGVTLGTIAKAPMEGLVRYHAG